MKAEVMIRAERPDDAPTIADIALRAYADVEYSNRREHLMIKRLRGTDACSPALSLSAEVEGEAAGERVQRRAADLGFGSILLVGIPPYYPQFGHEPLSRYPITLPFDAPDDNCMILPLAPNPLDGVAGRVQYAEGWLDH